MKGAIISLRSKSSLMVVKEMEKYFKTVDDIDLKNIEVNLGSASLEVLYEGKPMDTYDCVYLKGSFRYEPLLRSVATALYGKTYMPIKPAAFTVGHDKLLTQLDIQQHNIPMPTTYIAATADAAKKILKKVNYPIVMKFPHGSHGKGVMFADSYASASSMLDALAALRQPFVIQEYVESGGIDIRAIVVGSKVVASMKRKAEFGEKRANIHIGGVGEPCELDAHTKKLAINAAEAIEADICAVDILESAKGPTVIEINLSPGLQGITQATKVNVADKIAKFLHAKAKEFSESGKKETTKDILKEIEPSKEIITNLDFRGNKILLPEVITNITKFTEKDEVSVKANEGKVSIKKFSVGQEKK
ncbi:MAG: RimK family alpha-L-glutamate ligase [Candidatus Omnitrophota bacterium]|nr:MAG: RimK family alpha-L-glutamate ligase [Candidatus Omnitrophota bacterium]